MELARCMVMQLESSEAGRRHPANESEQIWLDRRIALGVAVFGLVCLFSVFGWTFGWYGKTAFWYDDAAHAVVPFGIALLVAVLLEPRIGYVARQHRLVAIMFATSTTISIAMFWEFAEWIYDLSVPNNAILGKRDTMIDLCLGTLGALIGSIVGVVLMSSGRQRLGRASAVAT